VAWPRGHLCSLRPYPPPSQQEYNIQTREYKEVSSHLIGCKTREYKELLRLSLDRFQSAGADNQLILTS
jgi:hypothetical protein